MLNTVEFHYDVVVLYSPQKLIFQPGETKLVDMKLKIKLPSTITGSVDYCFS